MAPELPPLVQRTLQRLIVAFAPERVILFGSYAKGTVRSRSDVDLLVVADLHGHRDLHRRRARQLAGDCFPRVDVVLATPLEVAEAGIAKSPFLQSILGSGIEIYVTNPGGSIMDDFVGQTYLSQSPMAGPPPIAATGLNLAPA